MKLYTEEQVRDCMSKSFAEGVCFGAAPMYKNESFDEIIKLQCPIELPTWDDVRKAFRSGAFNGSYYGNSSGKNIEVAEEEIIEQLKQDKK
jgi:hypothetical protein